MLTKKNPKLSGGAIFGKLRSKEVGASLVEYAILVALIATITLPSVSKMYFKSSDTMCATSYGMSTGNVVKSGEYWMVATTGAADVIPQLIYFNQFSRSCSTCSTNPGFIVGMPRCGSVDDG